MSEYQRANWFMRRVANPAVAFVIGRLGIGVRGGWLLTVAGRTTGVPHSVPVNPLAFNGQRYLVAPRGQTAWVRNLRVARRGELRRGGRRETFVATEVSDDEKPPILRAYLDRWYPETAAQFGVPKTATLEQLAAIASRHPVFRIERSVTA